MNYLFYDLETSGLEKPYDQIFQFGAIYADNEFNEIDTIDIRCNKLPEVVPSPQALMVTKVSPKDISSQKYSHYEMIHEVVAWLSDKQPCIFVGHNSMDFDENFMRFALYKTLNEPYLTSMNGNMRNDTMLLCHAVYHHSGDAMRFPVINGKLSFKLGPIARINGIVFPEEDAHDAFADVRATLDLAKFVRDSCPEVWRVMNSNASSANVKHDLDTEDYVHFSAVYFGKPYSYVVCKAAVSAENENEIAVFDLENDPAPFLDMEVHELIDALSSRKKSIRIIKANRSPIIFPKDMPSAYLKGEQQSSDVYEARSALIRSHIDFQSRLSEAMPQRYSPREASNLVEDQLYEEMFTAEDKLLMEKFHTVPWSDRNEITNELVDERLREIGNRLICTEAPKFADDDTLARFSRWVNFRLTTKDSVSWFTIDKALMEISDMASPDNSSDVALLEQIRQYILQMASDASA